MSTVQFLPYERQQTHDDVDDLLGEIRRLVARRAEAVAGGASADPLDARLAWLRGRLARIVREHGPDFDAAA
ncbi:MAG TPA: hypothetical protein VLN26_04380 [Gaiellaceae bacterium]|nr:hypothetical protein [Gaiellaceae bacterium]